MGVYTVILNIPRTPPSLNEILGKHWSKKYRLQKIFDRHVHVEWLRSGKFVFQKPVRVSYTIYLPDTRERDIDNYIGGTKLITDALKRTFITRDDSEWLQEISVRFLKGNEQTVCVIDEV